MKTFSGDCEIYLGREGGNEILKIIKNAKKSVKIVSPYLSPSYLKELVELSKKGREIILITSDKLPEGKGEYSSFKQSDIIKQKKIFNEEEKIKRKKLFWIFSVMLLIAVIFLGMFFLNMIFLWFGIFLGIISIIGFIYGSRIKIYSSEYSSIFKIKIFDSKSGEKPQSVNLIHAKIFVIDEKIAFLGSANFTYSGFKTHYETIIKINDIKCINNISKEIENLFNSTELDSKSINDLGKEIYEKSGIFD